MSASYLVRCEVLTQVSVLLPSKQTTWSTGNRKLSYKSDSFEFLKFRNLKVYSAFQNEDQRSNEDNDLGFSSSDFTPEFRDIRQSFEDSIESQKSMYKIVRKLGQGGQGSTFEALAENGIVVAIKIVSLKTMRGWKDLDLFKREARVLRSLNHPGIPNYIDDFEKDTKDNRVYFLVQNLAPGKSLEDLVSSGWRIPEEKVVDIACQILQILEYLESLRPPVIHRDIKPSNIIFDEATGKVQLVDFGAVLEASQIDLIGSTVVGTYGYMAPEQFQNRATSKSDLYSLGATLLFLLSGRDPNSFPQSKLKLDFQGVVEMSPKLEFVLSKLLEPVPESRFETAPQVLSFLKSSYFPGTLEIGESTSKLSKTRNKREIRQPASSKIIVKREENTLMIKIPKSSNISAVTGDAAFAAAWLSIVGLWTYNAVAARAPILFTAFSIPFWLSGFNMTARIGKSFSETEIFLEGLPLRSGTFKVSTTSLGQSTTVVQGFSNEIEKIALVEGMGIQILFKGKWYDIFCGDSNAKELDWLVSELNKALE